MLSYGNQHLQSLIRSYRLQRIKDSLGLLVVDQDMGDEVRSIHSLSGGKSFLVSTSLVSLIRFAIDQPSDLALVFNHPDRLRQVPAGIDILRRWSQFRKALVA